MTTTLLENLQTVAEHLDQLGQNWALIGGLAVSAYVEPRFTRDIDIVVSVADDAEAEEFVRKWREQGFQICSVVEQEATERLATIRSRGTTDDDQAIVDLMFASSGLEPEIAAEAEVLELAPGVEVPVARLGHLIALKVLSHDDESRPQDAIDLEKLAEIADEDELDAAREALRTIEARGYARGRNLQHLLQDYMSGTTHE